MFNHHKIVRLFSYFFFSSKQSELKEDRENSEFVFRENMWWWAAQIPEIPIHHHSTLKYGTHLLEAVHHHMLSQKTNSEFSRIFLTNQIVLNKYTCNSNSSSFNLDVRNTSTFIDELVTSDPSTVLPGLCFRKTSHFHVPDFSKPMLRIFIPHSPFIGGGY